MALTTFLAELQAETSCPVCLAPLQDPVTLDCGHNCCRPCLNQHWAGLLDVLPCPICQHHCPSREVRKNLLLGALADLLKQLPPASSQRKRWDNEEEALCAQHQQVMDLFCEEDLELLCAQCRASSPHQGHTLVPVEQAAAHHREKLKSLLEPLRRQLEEAERGLVLQVSRTWELIEKTEIYRRELDFQVQLFRSFLEDDRFNLEKELLREMSAFNRRVRESRNHMSDYDSSLRCLLSDVTTLCLQMDLKMLRGVRSIHRQWSRCVSLEVPVPFKYEFRKEAFSFPPQYVDLQTIISRFQVDLTLDPETAHHSLIISPDGKTAIFSGGLVEPGSVSHSQVFTSHEVVLGAEGFQAGRHFWQVNIRGAGVWSLGVCKESFLRNGLTTPSPSNGCWQFQRPTGLDLDPNTQQIQVGVLLDYELGELSFYNMETKSDLCVLKTTFTEKVFPYFSAVHPSSPFSMTIVTDEG